jgi:hypothetical protein
MFQHALGLALIAGVISSNGLLKSDYHAMRETGKRAAADLTHLVKVLNVII